MYVHEGEVEGEVLARGFDRSTRDILELREVSWMDFCIIEVQGLQIARFTFIDLVSIMKSRLSFVVSAWQLGLVEQWISIFAICNRPGSRDHHVVLALLGESFRDSLMLLAQDIVTRVSASWGRERFQPAQTRTSCVTCENKLAGSLSQEYAWSFCDFQMFL